MYELVTGAPLPYRRRSLRDVAKKRKAYRRASRQRAGFREISPVHLITRPTDSGEISDAPLTSVRLVVCTARPHDGVNRGSRLRSIAPGALASWRGVDILLHKIHLNFPHHTHRGAGLPHQQFLLEQQQATASEIKHGNKGCRRHQQRCALALSQRRRRVRLHPLRWGGAG